MLFEVATKAYSLANSLMAKQPSVTSGFRYMENAALTPLLKSMECDFAVDTSGLARSTYHQWLDHKWGLEIKESQWVSATCFAASRPTSSPSSRLLPPRPLISQYPAPFVQATVQNFGMREVLVDKAYLSKKNLRAVRAVGATAYVPIKSNSVGSNPKAKYDPLWNRMFHFYNLHRNECLTHYHKRSNVEPLSQ